MKKFNIPLKSIISLLTLSIFLAVTAFFGMSSAAEDSNLQAFINKQLTRHQVRKFLRQSSNVKSLKSDARVRFVYEPPEGMDQGELGDIVVDGPMDLTATLDMSSNSILNFLNYGDEKFQISGEVTGKMYGEVVKYSGEIRLVNETLYGIVNTLPDTIIETEPELQKIQGTWYAYKIKNMDNLRKLFSNSSNSKVNAVLSDEDIDKLITLMSDPVIQSRYTKNTYLTPDGFNATCLNFKYNGEQLYALALKATQIYGESTDYLDSADYEAVKNLAFSLCSDDNFKNLYKTTFDLLVESEEIGSIVVEYEQVNYNHNQDLQVAAPTNAILIDDNNNSLIIDDYASMFEGSAAEVSGIVEQCKDLGGQAFPDVTESFNEYDSIVYSKNNGIVNGYSDGCFRPYNEVTREQLIAILIRGKHTSEEIQNCTEASFVDVDDNNKLKGEICVAKKNGYISGYTDGTFKPSRFITFEESAKMIANVYGINNTEVNNDEYKFNTYVTALDQRKAIPDVISCKNDSSLRADITEIIYRLRNNIDTKEYTSKTELLSC